MTIETLSLDLWPWPSARLEQVDVDAAALFDGGAPQGAARRGGLGFELAAEVHQLRVRWGETPLLEGLSGPLSPALSLRGERGSLERTAAGWRGATTVPVALGWARGVAEVELVGSDACELRASIPALVLDHPLLATAPLAPVSVTVEAARHRDGTLDGILRIEDVATRFSGTTTLAPLAMDLELATATTLSDVVGLLGAAVPEARRAELAGTVSASATLQGWPLRWTLAPHAEKLAAAGVIDDLSGMRQGPFTWRAPSASGPRPRSSGEGHPQWTPLDQAGPFAQAVIAAEDARFWSHPGYDLEGVQVAIDAVAAGEERPRGGSTLTQQLAKNLFLDGERTVARKTRELLYALEMERLLGKKRILELYLNVVELGPDLYGVRAAADAYFLKKPEALSWREAAFLAAILPSPRTWGAEAWAGGRPPNARIEAILDNLVRLGAIDETTAGRARRETLRFVPPPTPTR